MPAFVVQLPFYAGPLDLLLYLVRRAEVELPSLPLATITRQYLEFLEVLQAIEFDSVGDFVVTASALLELKSREVLPRTQEESIDDQPPDDDPLKAELLNRLLEYQRFKDAAAQLDLRATEWQRRYPRLADDRPTVSRDHSADPIREVELWDLVSALTRVLQRTVSVETARVRYDETPVAVYAERISARVYHEQRVPFSAFFEQSRDRQRVIGVFLAILELLRHHGFRAEQPVEYGEIYILPPRSDTRAAEPSSLPADANPNSD
jgi:segregation and condensation protein A